MSKQIPWFGVAKVTILAVTGFHMVPVIWNLPNFYLRLASLQPNKGLPGWTQAELQSAAQIAGFSPQFLAALLFGASLTCLLCFWGIAGVLFWRKGNSWIGLLSIIMLTGTGAGFSFFIIDSSILPAWLQGFYLFTVLLVWPTFFLLLYLFPDGRFVPSWTRYLAPLPYTVFLSSLWFGDNQSPGWLLGLLGLYLSGGLASQVYRYSRASNPEQRQQTKWVLFAVSLFVVNLIIGQLAPVLFPALKTNLRVHFYFDVFYNYFLGALLSALIPISIGLSILRYRLWDVDIIIRRTLTYSLLTAILALFYFGSVVLLQSLFALAGGQHSPAIIVISTLIIAALFNPLRNRLQLALDKRFYRSKYDAEQALASFAVAVRDKVDLQSMSQALLTTVEETVQPVQVSLWIGKNAEPEREMRS